MSRSSTYTAGIHYYSCRPLTLYVRTIERACSLPIIYIHEFPLSNDFCMHTTYVNFIFELQRNSISLDTTSHFVADLSITTTTLYYGLRPDPILSYATVPFYFLIGYKTKKNNDSPYFLSIYLFINIVRT